MERARENDTPVPRAFGVEEAIYDAGVVTLDYHHGHPCIRSLVVEGREVITF